MRKIILKSKEKITVIFLKKKRFEFLKSKFLQMLGKLLVGREYKTQHLQLT